MEKDYILAYVSKNIYSFALQISGTHATLDSAINAISNFANLAKKVIIFEVDSTEWMNSKRWGSLKDGKERTYYNLGNIMAFPPSATVVWEKVL